MHKTLALLALAIIVARLVGVGAASGPAALQYYVGTWSCRAGVVGKPAVKSTVTYTLSSGLLHEWVDVPAQGMMTKPYLNSIAISYDSGQRRFVQTGTDNEGFWWVSFAEPWTGNTERWTNQAASDHKIRRYEWVRASRNTYSFTEYPSLTAKVPDFKGTCSRVS